MSSSLPNRVFEALKSAGVREIIICPGGRNAEFVELASTTSDFKVIWHFEERSAAFLALGRIQATDRPVAVIVTSGTAAGELLPATMEAFYSGLPLVLITADRPRRFRGSGAPQSAEQLGLFGIYAPFARDLEGEDVIHLLNDLKQPVHLNVCLEDPKGRASAGIEGIQPADVNEFLQLVHQPLVILGKIKQKDRLAVREFLVRLNAPIYAEALSGLRQDPSLQHLLIAIPDGILKRHTFDGVLRIGGVPTHRLWRDLEDSYIELPVLSVSDLPFTGLSRKSGLAGGIAGSLSSLVVACKNRSLIFEEQNLLREGLRSLFKEFPTSEPAIINSVSSIIPAHSNVFLGNSLSIRQWDLVAETSDKVEIFASRGLNGIDGQISTFLGVCEPGKENWAVLGDLTVLYDMSGPWPFSQLSEGITGTIVSINNGGGQIFDRMFENRNFINSHRRSLEGFAKIWNLEYRINLSRPVGPGLRIIELVPDPDQTKGFWTAFGELVK